jgi:hypothetical protein
MLDGLGHAPKWIKERRLKVLKESQNEEEKRKD